MTETGSLSASTQKSLERSGKILKVVLVMAIPIILGNLLEVITEIVDLHFIGDLAKVNGQHILAGASGASSITALMITLMVGVSVAVAAFISRAHGQGHKEAISIILSHALIIGVIISIIIAVIGVFFSGSLMLMVTHGNVQNAEIGVEYLQPLLVGIFPLVLLLICSVAFQSVGHPLIPMVMLIIVNIINVVLNPILIHQFGLAGSAYATLIARGFGGIVLLILLLTLKCAKESGLGFKMPKFDGKLFVNMLGVAVPSSIQGCIRNVGLLVMTAIIAAFGTAELGAYGICTRTDIIGMMIGMGLAQTTCILVGQSLGEKRPDKATRYVKYAVLINAIIMSIIAVVFITAAPAILEFFGAKGDVLSVGLIWMSCVPLASILMGIALTLGYAMNGAGLTWPGMIASLTGQVIVPIAIAVFASTHHLPVAVVFIGVCIGIIANFIIDFAFYMSGIWKKHEIRT